MRLDELEGKIIGERFLLRSMIGKGGYGAVFEAEQLSVGRRCAVKIMLPGRSDDTSVEERFRAEARATSMLTHPNSLVLYDFGVDEATGYLFLATEFLDGVTLYDVLEVERVLAVERTLRILEQIAGSLADAHRHGLVHRDIKPKNVMLIRRAEQEDFVKVIDFGIAKALFGDLAHNDGLTQTGMLIGTPQYMAPEQLLGTGLDERVDQYAMAVLGYKLLTGRNPFQAASPMETAMRHVSERPLPLRTYRPELEVNAEFEDVFLKALEKTPEHRHRSVTAFVQALRKAQGEGRGMEKEASPEPPAQKPLKATIRLDSIEMAAISAGQNQAEEEEEDYVEQETELLLAEPEVVKKVAPTRALTPVKAESLDLSETSSEASPAPAVEIDFDGAIEDENDGDSLEVEPRIIAREEERTTGTMALPAVGSPAKLSPVIIAVAAVSALFLFGTLGVFLLGGKNHPDEPALLEEASEQETAVMASAEYEQNIELQPEEETAPEEKEERPDLEPALQELRAATMVAVAAGDKEAKKAEEERQRRLARRPGQVTVTLIPWGTLFIDGKAYSSETRQRVRLAPGRYEFSLLQAGQERARRVVDVEAGANKMVILEAKLTK